MKKGLLRITASLAAMILCGSALVGCNNAKEPEEKEAEILSVGISNKDALQEEWGLNDGARTVNIATYPETNATQLKIDGRISFSSSNPTVATVDEAGKITPVAVGEAVITVIVDNSIYDRVAIKLVETRFDSLASCLEAYGKGQTGPFAFKGTITALIGTKAFIVQNGDVGVYMYENPETVLGTGVALKVGDVIGVSTNLQTYNELVESKRDTTIMLLKEAPEQFITKTVTNADLTPAHISTIVNVNGVKASGELIPCEYNSVYGQLPIRDASLEKDYLIYINKYLPKETIAAINEKLNLLANGPYVANLKNVVVSTYSGYQYLVTDPAQIELVKGEEIKPTSFTITNAETDYKIVLGSKLQLTTSFEPANCTSKGLVCTSSDENIATVSETGLIIATGVGKAKITVQSESVGILKHEIEIEVINPDFLVNAPVAGEQYFLAIEQANIGKVIYAVDEMDDYYGKTVTDVTKASKLVCEAGTGANEGLFALKLGAKYIDITLSGTYINYGFADTPAYFSWDAANFTFYKTMEGSMYYFGTNTKYNTVSVKKDVLQEFPIRLYASYMISAPEVGSTIKLGGYHTGLTPAKYIFLNGEMDGTYAKTSAAGINFTVEAGTKEGTYALKDANGKYLACYQPAGKSFYAPGYADAKSTTTDLLWNEGLKAFTSTSNPAYETFVGTQSAKNYETVGWSNVSYASTSVIFRAFLVSGPVDEKAPTKISYKFDKADLVVDATAKTATIDKLSTLGFKIVFAQNTSNTAITQFAGNTNCRMYVGYTVTITTDSNHLVKGFGFDDSNSKITDASQVTMTPAGTVTYVAKRLDCMANEGAASLVVTFTKAGYTTDLDIFVIEK